MSTIIDCKVLEFLLFFVFLSFLIKSYYITHPKYHHTSSIIFPLLPFDYLYHKLCQHMYICMSVRIYFNGTCGRYCVKYLLSNEFFMHITCACAWAHVYFQCDFCVISISIRFNIIYAGCYLISKVIYKINVLWCVHYTFSTAILLPYTYIDTAISRTIKQQQQ